MFDYTIRCQLVGSPSSATYASLKAKMAAFGASDHLSGSDGYLYEMPYGEYRLVSAWSQQEVHRRAAAAVAGVGGGAVVVSSVTARYFSGLKRIASNVAAALTAATFRRG